MAGEGPANMIARRVVESRRFVNHMHDEAATAKDYVAQLTALISKLQAMKDQEEVHDGLLATKDAKRGEEAKLVALNDVIAKVLNEIETLENNVEILDEVLIIVDWCSHLVDCMLYYAGSVEGCSTARLQCRRLQHRPFTVRSATELEGLDEQGNAMRAFENMKLIVARDYVTLGILEQLLARA
nr:hypothetical protein [Tanacetum cinerariifolium]